tara:strand:+ start:1043 stop:1765 length:723 start_codon:yes stop_codon:yes gene_type:complete
MRKIIFYLLKKVSRTIYSLIHEIKDDLTDGYIARKLNEEKHREVLEVFGNHLKKSIRFTQLKQIRKYAIDLALSNASDKSDKEDLFFMEFGVFNGTSANFFSKYVNKLYAFDSFEGLPEEWEGVLPKGYFNLNKKIPNLNSNVVPIVGFVENTLDDFLKKNNPKINFVHIDMDLYNPTKFTLEKIKPYLVKGAIILFDELYNYVNWKEGEYKALKEVFGDDEYLFRAFNINQYQVVIQII